MAEHRARVLTQVQALAADGDVLRGFPVGLGGADDHGGSLAQFEELVVADPSLQIKAGVQWGLFAGAILHLGTADHHRRFLPDAMSVAVPGVFAMTETGHGSDVASIGTTAVYDIATQEFVIHTPFRAAWKDYLGSAAEHGTAAVLFAQLITGGVNHGVHAFYVPLRNPATREFWPGIGGEDDGLKGGLNGIDNGRLHFDHVRIPRTNLLNQYGDVAPDGTYSSPIASPGRRFFTMLGTLVQGRVSLDGAAVNVSKLALVIAVTYGNQRRQFTGGSEAEEVVLLDYAEHQRRLLPLVAETYAAHFAHEKLLETFDDVFSGATDTDEDREDLETLAAALKPMSTWHALKTLQTAREACGGAGFLAENRLVSLRADLDVFVTFEGDNTVLLQLVAKRLLADHAREFKDIDAGGVARYVANRAADAALHRTPLLRAVQTLSDGGNVRRSAGALRVAETQRELLTDRVETMVAEVATALRPATKSSREDAAALFNAHQHALIEAARAHAELVQWHEFTAGLERIDDPGTRQVLTWVRDLFGLSIIERNLAWYLINGRLSAGRARTVTSYIARLHPSRKSRCRATSRRSPEPGGVAQRPRDRRDADSGGGVVVRNRSHVTRVTRFGACLSDPGAAGSLNLSPADLSAGNDDHRTRPPVPRHRRPRDRDVAGCAALGRPWPQARRVPADPRHPGPPAYRRRARDVLRDVVRALLVQVLQGAPEPVRREDDPGDA